MNENKLQNAEYESNNEEMFSNTSGSLSDDAHNAFLAAMERVERQNKTFENYSNNENSGDNAISEPEDNVEIETDAPDDVYSAEVEEKKQPAIRRRRLSKRDLLIMAIPAVVIIAAIIGINMFMTRVTTYILPDNAAVYFGGLKVNVKKGTAFSVDDDGKSILMDGKRDEIINDFVLYHDESDTVTITEDMIYYDPREHVHSRVDRLSEISVLKNGGIRISRGGIEKTVSPGFLFNGKDKYIVLEKMDVTINGFKDTIAPLSYIMVTPATDVSVLNYENKEFNMETARDEVTAVSEDEAFIIRIIGNSMTTIDGWDQLLFSKPQELDSII